MNTLEFLNPLWQARTRFPGLLIFLPVIALKVIFLLSYPLNITEDGYNYYTNMLLPGRAMLVHAGGYPFLWGMFLHNFRYFIDTSPVFFELIYVFSQHLFDLFCLVVLYKVVVRYLGLGTAVLSLYFSGLSVFYLSFASMATPEWLQADLWLLFIVSLFVGIQKDLPFRNVLLILSVILLELSFLVKFNSLILIVFYLPVFLIEKSRGNIPNLVKNLLRGATIAIAIHLIYLFGYHFPTTGTYKLHYDSGWVLITRVNSLVAEGNGINTKRLFALNGSLPENYSQEAYRGNLYKHIDGVPLVDRQPYRNLYQKILSKNEAQLDRYVANHPAWKEHQFYNYVLRVQYYVGLKEGDDLGRQAAYEAIVSHPVDYFLSIGTAFFRIRPNIWVPLFLPSIADLDQNAKLIVMGESVFRSYAVPYYSWNQVFRTNQPISRFWKPGLDFLNLICFSAAWPTLAILFWGTVISLYEILIKRHYRWDILIFSSLLLFILLFVLISNTILIFRYKELRVVYPLVGVCVGLSIMFALESAARVHTRKNYVTQGS